MLLGSSKFYYDQIENLRSSVDTVSVSLGPARCNFCLSAVISSEGFTRAIIINIRIDCRRAPSMGV